jgi:hypothetical protein
MRLTDLIRLRWYSLSLSHHAYITTKTLNTGLFALSLWKLLISYFSVDCGEKITGKPAGEVRSCSWDTICYNYSAPNNSWPSKKSIGGGIIQSQTSIHTTWPVFNQSQNSSKFRQGSTILWCTVAESEKEKDEYHEAVDIAHPADDLNDSAKKGENE